MDYAISLKASSKCTRRILTDLLELTPFTVHLPAQTISSIHLFQAASGRGTPLMKVRLVPLVSTHSNNRSEPNLVFLFS